MNRTPKAKAKIPTTKPAAAKLGPADLTALLRAIELGLVPKVQALTAKGNVDVKVKLKYGMVTTPLAAAAHGKNAEIVALLVRAGGNLEEVDTYGRSLLHGVRDVAVATTLLDAGADLHARDKRGRTPLHAAAELGDVALVELYLARGAEVDALDGKSVSPYVVASDRNVRATLKAHGAKGLARTAGRALQPKQRAAKPSEVAVDGGALAVDAAGDVWIGGPDAIYRWDGTQATAYVFEESFAVSEIGAGPAGRMYFATNWGLLVREGDVWQLYGTDDSELHDAHITDLAVDREGRACVMGYGDEETFDRPISVFDGKGFTVWSANQGFPAGHETNRIAFDAKNRLVLGSNDGLVFADGTRWSVPGGSGRLAATKVLVADGDAVWACSRRSCSRVTPTGKVTATFQTPDGPKCLVVDGDTIYVGMSYGGLLRVRGADQRHWKGEASGLEHDDVEGLALGRDGTLWIAAGSALFRLRGDVIARFDGKPFDAKAPLPKAAEPAPPKPAPPPKAAPKRKLAKAPAAPLVPRAKIAKHVVVAIEAARLEGLTTELLLRLVRPAIGIVVGKAAAIRVGCSKLGGRPDLVAGAKWPTYRDDRARYLPFLMQIDLAEVTKHDVEGLLPKKGRLAFFCDTQPDELSDARVVFIPGGKASRLEWPEDLVDRKNEDDFVAMLPEHAISFYPTWTLPSAELLSRYAELTAQDRAALGVLEEKVHALDPKGSSTTRLLGWPNTLQGEIVTSPDTIVVLQIDGEMKGPKKLGELFSYWGNGMAHYLVKRSDLAAKKLEKASAELAYT